MTNKSVSIIIAVKNFNANLKQCIDACLNLDYSDFDILVFPDQEFDYAHDKVKIIPTGNITPGKKRNLSLKHTNAEVLAFIDDDAYQVHAWLNNVMPNFEDSLVAAVGGPAITPNEDNLKQKASGLIYESLLVSGPSNYRYLPRKKAYVDDFPSCNFIIRRDVFAELGGFDENYWPGEDTVLCLRLTKHFNKKIAYEPLAVIYHHRRPVFKPHLKQINSYALHRGYFVKRFPETSLRFSYFVPSLFVLYLAAGIFLKVMPPFLRGFYLAFLSFYCLLVVIFSLQSLRRYPHQFKLIPYVFFGIIFTHIAYGINFFKGLFSKELQV